MTRVQCTATIATVLLSVVSVTHAAESILERVPELQQIASKAGRGQLGCGAGTVILITSRGPVTADCGLDPIHVFGTTIKTVDLIEILRARAEANRTGKPNSMSGEVGTLAFVCLYTLALSKDPEVVPTITALLTDNDDVIRGWAAIALFRLGDADEGIRRMVLRIPFPEAALTSAVTRGEQTPHWLELKR